MARRRPARRVKTLGGRPFRLDDAVAIPTPPPANPSAVRVDDLSGRTRLDARIAQALAERTRFEARGKSNAAAETKT